MKVLEIFKEEIENVSSKLKLDDRKKKLLEEEIEKYLNRALLEPGTSIGIITAQSISEPATQLTMRSYHVAGSAGIKMTQGLPRLIEIFDAKKELENPSMFIYLKKKFDNEKDAKKFAEKIVEKVMKDFLEEISMDLFEKKIEIRVRGEENAEKIYNLLKEKKFKVRKYGEKIQILLEESNLGEMKKIKERILNFYVDGIPGIKNAAILKEGESWLIQTSGSNLEKLLEYEEVDITRTYSNNIHEVAKVFGIEAARNLIIEEVNKTMKEQGIEVNYQFLSLIADLMCFSGTVQPVGRYGIAGKKGSVLARANFEETVKHLILATLRNEKEKFEGIFENVFIGRVAPVGTNAFELITEEE